MLCYWEEMGLLKQRIHAFSNDQEHPHDDQPFLESVVNRETSVVAGGKNPSFGVALVVWH